MDHTIEGPFGARQLSDADWLKLSSTKVYYLHLKKSEEPYKHWTRLHFQIAAKYCLSRCSDWFYHSGDEFVFGSFEDLVLFKLWVTNNRQIHQQTEVTIE
jgi:hypothetical protein